MAEQVCLNLNQLEESHTPCPFIPPPGSSEASLDLAALPAVPDPPVDEPPYLSAYNKQLQGGAELQYNICPGRELGVPVPPKSSPRWPVLLGYFCLFRPKRMSDCAHHGVPTVCGWVLGGSKHARQVGCTQGPAEVPVSVLRVLPGGKFPAPPPRGDHVLS